ncbi:MAG: sigma-70 family RNA polymerase sigma factor [Prevotella sp.]|nr:sigma-70 family RNA polymerase sigma factor [Prevotella sp.]
MDNRQILADYYQLHREELLAFTTKHLQGDRMTAEDVVQNTFLRLLTGIQLTTTVTLPALAYTTLRHLLTDVWRHRQCLHRLEEQYTVYASSFRGDDVFGRCYISQVTDLLNRRIDRLSDNCARVMRLSMLEERPVSEIAELLAMKYKTVENHLLVGRKTIRPGIKRLLAG